MVSPNLIAGEKELDHGEDTGERSPFLNERIFGRDNQMRIEPPKVEASPSELFSGQFASALDSFASPAKQPFNEGGLESNLWISELDARKVLFD